MADPFAVFGLEPVFALDGDLLKKRLLRFTRLVHPDFFATAGDEMRGKAEAASALLNAAYETLADDAARADWIVRHLGGPDERAERSMPKAFLLEVLDWNETLEAARGSSASAAQIAAVGQLETELAQRRSELFKTIAGQLGLLTERSAPLLALVRQELNAARYLDKTLLEIAGLRLTQSLSR